MTATDAPAEDKVIDLWVVPFEGKTPQSVLQLQLIKGYIAFMVAREGER